MRRLDARLSDRRNSVSSRSRLGKTENCDRPQNLNRGQQHQHRRGDAEGQQQIEQQAGQRHQHHEDQAHGGDRHDPLGSGLGLDRGSSSQSAAEAFAGIGQLLRRMRRRLRGPRLRAPDGRQDFGDDGVEFGRNGLTHFDRAVERVRQRRILHQRNAVPERDFADLRRQQVASLGHDDGRLHLHAEFERDRELGGIGDHDRGALDVLQHAAAACLALQAADAHLDRGIAFGLLELVAQILPAHLEFVLVAPALEEIVGGRPHQQHQRRLPGQLEHVAGGEGHEPAAAAVQRRGKHASSRAPAG